MDIEQEYLEDEMPEDEDEDDEEDFDEEDLVYEPGTEDDDQAMHNGDWGWDDHTPPTLARGHHHHHYHHHRGTQPWMFAGGAHDPMMGQYPHTDLTDPEAHHAEPTMGQILYYREAGDRTSDRREDIITFHKPTSFSTPWIPYV
ncbi:hypothetical protein LTR16_008504 [Cryomyces antarcticus]|uniref:Uncharacterized protein n=1 Tax=Cryomyces antarcticus TaxID=329879 RepID=A0ABR0JZ98_9PEZI|nr:hypothetical protein LTR16_008504 [Cryomyces antarcticus]